MNEEKTRLSADKYVIEQSEHGFVIYANHELGGQEWIATASDPKVAMDIVEGLILVEMKRFYYPDSDPTFVSGDEKPLPPFLKKRN